MNKDKVLQMESQVEELAAVRQKNKNLEDGVNSLKKELEVLKRERSEWESGQLELMLQRDKTSSKQHPQLQQDLNQSGLSNLSGYTHNKKGKLFEQSDAKQHLVSRMPNSIEHSSAAK